MRERPVTWRRLRGWLGWICFKSARSAFGAVRLGAPGQTVSMQKSMAFERLVSAPRLEDHHQWERSRAPKRWDRADVQQCTSLPARRGRSRSGADGAGRAAAGGDVAVRDRCHVLTVGDEHIHGMTANAFGSVSIESYTRAVKLSAHCQVTGRLNPSREQWITEV